MICIPLPARTNEQMRAMMAQAAPLADLLELRVDGIPEPDLRYLLEDRPRPVIVTNRPAEEGGLYAGTEQRRLQVLEEAASLGAEYVDIELAAAGLCRASGAKRIISVHDFNGMPDDLDRIHRQICDAGADVAKIAVMATGILDNLRIFDLLKSAAIPTIALAMGECGQVSRILGRKFGAFLTFAALDEKSASAPGQVTAERMRNEFRYQSIGPDTQVCGVIANPVAHSLSPAMHNAAFAEYEMDFVYLPFLVEDLAEFVTAFRALEVVGYSVTIPHKGAALRAADQADELSRRIGAANTLYRRGESLMATNTDYAGALDALEEEMDGNDPLAGRAALLLGAGGAARALAFGLKEKGARVTIANRTFERGEKLAQETGARACHLEDLPSLTADVLINTTSVGMHPRTGASPVPREILRRGMIVFDAVYNPRDTLLIRHARAAGCRIVYGARWLVNQAALQFQLWTGKDAPRRVMERALEERLG